MGMLDRYKEMDYLTLKTNSKMKLYSILLLFFAVLFEGCSKHNFAKAYLLNRTSKHFSESKYFINKEYFGKNFYVYSHIIFFNEGTVFQYGTTDSLLSSSYVEAHKLDSDKWGYYSKTDSVINVSLFQKPLEYYTITDNHTLIDTLKIPNSKPYKAQYKLSSQNINTMPNNIWNKYR